MSGTELPWRGLRGCPQRLQKWLVGGQCPCSWSQEVCKQGRRREGRKENKTSPFTPVMRISKHLPGTTPHRNPGGALDSYLSLSPSILHPQSQDLLSLHPELKPAHPLLSAPPPSGGSLPLQLPALTPSGPPSPQHVLIQKWTTPSFKFCSGFLCRSDKSPHMDRTPGTCPLATWLLPCLSLP